MPLPSFSGSAAVPSTVDVYVNNLRTFSHALGAGPYSLSNIPAVSGSGVASIMLTDSAGRQTRTTLPFYTSARLLAPGMTDFSAEAGYPRVGFGAALDAYLNKAVASASLRRGIFDGLTVEAHAEGGAGIVNGGAGINAVTGSFGLASIAGSASWHKEETGFQIFASYETAILGLKLNAASQRTFGVYEDLASITASYPEDGGTRRGLSGLFYISPYELGPLLASARPPKAVDRISIGLPVPFDQSSVSASFIRTEDGEGRKSHVLTGSWSRTFAGAGTLVATGFADVADRGQRGAFLSWSMPLGASASATAAMARGLNATTRVLEAVKPLEQEVGSYGWRARANDGKSTEVGAAGSYRSSFGKVEIAAAQNRVGLRTTFEADGAIATLGGDLFLTNRIDDAFAVVETGMPGLEVHHQNRLVGHTTSSGRLLIPGLRAYEKNQIAIDLRGAPLDAEAEHTTDVVVPADRSGVRVKMAVRTETRSAVVVVSLPDGRFIPVGSEGQLVGGDSFVVGYDGRAFVKNLQPQNEAVITLTNGQCRVRFEYTPRENEQVLISPVICQPPGP